MSEAKPLRNAKQERTPINLKVRKPSNGASPMSLSTPKPSYAGKDIYVGIDVHKRSYSVYVSVERTKIKQWRMPASARKLTEQLQRHYGEGHIHTVYEAGFSGFDLHRELTTGGIDSLVVHAAAVETAAHNRIKTDKRDAQKLAIQLESGRLSSIRIPTREEERKRLLSRTRAQLVKARTRLKIQMRMKAHQFGLIGAEDRREMSHRFVQDLLDCAVGEEFTLSISALLEVWKSLDIQIKRLEQQLKEQAAADPNEATYRSAPAVGPISARVLSNELGDMKQFQNERQLFSYTGLTPSEHSSGQRIHKGRITKQGNAHLRGILIELAWRALRKDPGLAQHYQHLSARMESKQAIVAVARKLIGRIRAAFRKGELYQIPNLEDLATAP